jgi:hypothetical protein
VWSIRTGPFDKPELIAEALKAVFINKECIIPGGFTVTKVLHHGVFYSLVLIEFKSSPPWCGKNLAIGEGT